MNIRRDAQLERARQELKRRDEGVPGDCGGSEDGCMYCSGCVRRARAKLREDVRPYRSVAEKRGVTQRNIQIALVATNVLISALIALKTFEMI